MPIIQSKKYPENERFISVKSWTKWVESGRAKHFIIADDGDMQDTVIAAPSSFTDFSKPPEVTVGTSENETEEMNREDLKKWLDEHEIEYNVRTSTPKLYQLYLDNQ